MPPPDGLTSCRRMHIAPQADGQPAAASSMPSTATGRRKPSTYTSRRAAAKMPMSSAPASTTCSDRKRQAPPLRRGFFLSIEVRLRLFHVARDEFSHLEHRHLPLAAEERFELVIREDVALVLGILQVVLLYIHPDLLNHLTARHRTLADDRLELRR